jgi:hypothetical protein
MIDDPRIVRLAGEAEYEARHYNPYKGVMVWTDRATKQIVVTTVVEGPMLEAPDGMAVHAFFKLGDIDELLRDLLAARADLVKLNGGQK